MHLRTYVLAVHTIRISFTDMPIVAYASPFPSPSPSPTPPPYPTLQAQAYEGAS